jgi:hypothetical protein
MRGAYQTSTRAAWDTDARAKIKPMRTMMGVDVRVGGEEEREIRWALGDKRSVAILDALRRWKVATRTQTAIKGSYNQVCPSKIRRIVPPERDLPPDTLEPFPNSSLASSPSVPPIFDITRHRRDGSGTPVDTAASPAPTPRILLESDSPGNDAHPHGACVPLRPQAPVPDQEGVDRSPTPQARAQACTA